MKHFGLLLLKSTPVGIAYTVATILVGGLLNAVGRPIVIAASQDLSVLLWTAFASGFLIGLTLGWLKTLFTSSRFKTIFVFTSIVFLNISSVIIEGAFFAPGLLPLELLPRILLQYLLLAALVSLLVLFLFPSKTKSKKDYSKPYRSLKSWTLRFLASALSYVLFYFVFGAINYELVTRPYYEAHGGLAVPETGVVLLAEAIRAVLIILSIVPLLSVLRGSRKTQVLACGSALFIVGGIVPLLLQIGNLPAILLLASAVEIFFQNFLTGAVAAILLGNHAATKLNKTKPQLQQQL